VVDLAGGAPRSPTGWDVATVLRRARRAAGRAPGRLALALAAAAALLAASCSGPTPPLRIVYPYPWLGSELGRVAQQAIASWGPGPPVRIVDTLEPAAPLASGYAGDIDFAEMMTAQAGTVAAVGPQSSRATLLVAPIYAEHHIPMIVATATSGRLRDLGSWIFQLAPDDDAEGGFIADFVVNRLAARRVTIFYLDADEYGVGLRDGVVRGLRRHGIEPRDEVGIIEETDLPRRVAESLGRATPDVVVVAARSPQALGIAQAVYTRLPGVKIVAGDGVPLNGSFIRAAGPATAAVYAVAWWQPGLGDSASRAFAGRFRAATGRLPSPAEAMYYDAIMVAARAAHEVGARPAAIRRWLASLGVSRPPYAGVTGPISFAPERAANLLMTRVAGDTAVAAERPGAGP
jgi:ABC-type branched-subunit amino acid transport system substrate-binding protein